MILGVGFVLWQNPLTVQEISGYKNEIPQGFPADFPADPNIIEITKNQKIVSVEKGETEFILEYTTTRSWDETLAIISGYALSKELFFTDDNITEDSQGNNYYFTAENRIETESISINIFVPSGSKESYVKITIFNKALTN